MSVSSVCPVCRAELDPIEAGRCGRCAVSRNSPLEADKRRKRKAATPSRSQHTETEKDDLEPESAEEEEESRRAEEKPSRHSKDPLRGFFLQTILECRGARTGPRAGSASSRRGSCTCAPTTRTSATSPTTG